MTTDASFQVEIPLLQDHHSHPLLYAALLPAVDLSEVKNLDQACDLISTSAGRSNVVVAHGWKDSYFKFPIGRLEQLPPVAIFNLSLHRLLVNESGRRLLAMQFGSEIDKLDDPDWYERNMRVVLNWFARLNGSPAALTDFYDHLQTLGVWSTEELLLVDQQEIQWFDEAGLTDRTKFWAAPDTFEELSDLNQQKVHGLKLFTDGAIGTSTAAISRPYCGSSTNRGILVYSDHQLQQTIAKCAKTRKAIAIHAIGDRAIEQTLTAVQAIGDTADSFDEIRIEHAQLISHQQAQRAKNLNIVLSMQPNFNSDTVDYADRLPDDVAQSNNPFRMLIDDVGFEPGIDLIFGSDGMPHGAKVALQQSLYPSIPNQRLTLDEFQKGYCCDTPMTFKFEINGKMASKEETRNTET